MFHLIKILNGRIGVPEPERITLASAATVNYGTPVCIKGGTLTPVTASSALFPTHLVLKDSTGSEVLVTRISPEMIFEVKTAAAPSTLSVGTEYLLSADGKALSGTAASGDKRGAYLINKAGAREIGDTVCVAFR